ncbi:2552_t:CDS:2, partial [Funneliformis geosporum]
TTFLMNLTITMDSEQQSKEKQNQAAEQQQLIPALENETVLSMLKSEDANNSGGRNAKDRTFILMEYDYANSFGFLKLDVKIHTPGKHEGTKLTDHEHHK